MPERPDDDMKIYIPKEPAEKEFGCQSPSLQSEQRP